MKVFPAVPGLVAGLGDGPPIVGWTAEGRPVYPEEDFERSEVIPAQPGWSAIQYARATRPKDQWWVERYSVVAWRVVTRHWFVDFRNEWRRDVLAEPVVASMDDTPGGLVVVSPEGRVFGFEEVHETVDAWEVEARARFERGLAVVVERAAAKPVDGAIKNEES